VNATTARRDAVERLVEICEASWDVDLILRRPASIQVLVRKALDATKHDDEALAEVYELWPVATGRTEPLIDAALHGITNRPVPAPTTTVEELEAALVDWRNAS
jgi:hypothetical protein